MATEDINGGPYPSADDEIQAGGWERHFDTQDEFEEDTTDEDTEQGSKPLDYDPLTRTSEVLDLLNKHMGPHLLRFLIREEVSPEVKIRLEESMQVLRDELQFRLSQSVSRAEMAHFVANVDASLKRIQQIEAAAIRAAERAESGVEIQESVYEQLNALCTALNLYYGEAKKNMDTQTIRAVQLIESAKAEFETIRIQSVNLGQRIIAHEMKDDRHSREIAELQRQSRLQTAALAILAIGAIGHVISNKETPQASAEENISDWSSSEIGFEDTVNMLEDMEATGLVVNCGSFDLENGQPSEFARVNSPSVKGWMSKADVLEACEGSNEVKFRVEY